MTSASVSAEQGIINYRSGVSDGLYDTTPIGTSGFDGEAKRYPEVQIDVDHEEEYSEGLDKDDECLWCSTWIWVVSIILVLGVGGVCIWQFSKGGHRGHNSREFEYADNTVYSTDISTQAMESLYTDVMTDNEIISLDIADGDLGGESVRICNWKSDDEKPTRETPLDKTRGDDSAIDFDRTQAFRSDGRSKDNYPTIDTESKDDKTRSDWDKESKGTDMDSESGTWDKDFRKHKHPKRGDEDENFGESGEHSKRVRPTGESGEWNKDFKHRHPKRDHEDEFGESSDLDKDFKHRDRDTKHGREDEFGESGEHSKRVRPTGESGEWDKDFKHRHRHPKHGHEDSFGESGEFDKDLKHRHPKRDYEGESSDLDKDFKHRDRHSKHGREDEFGESGDFDKEIKHRHRHPKHGHEEDSFGESSEFNKDDKHRHPKHGREGESGDWNKDFKHRHPKHGHEDEFGDSSDMKDKKHRHRDRESDSMDSFDWENKFDKHNRHNRKHDKETGESSDFVRTSESGAFDKHDWNKHHNGDRKTTHTEDGAEREVPGSDMKRKIRGKVCGTNDDVELTVGRDSVEGRFTKRGKSWSISKESKPTKSRRGGKRRDRDSKHDDKDSKRQRKDHESSEDEKDSE